MKLWTGIITEKLNESKAFYQSLLEAQVLFENEWFVLLNMEGFQLGLMLPNLTHQAPIFRSPLAGPGVWFTIDVDKVDEQYARIKSLDFEIAVDIRDEPWGDRHFAVKDPNGIGIDFVKHVPV